jgi:hypothetical protein
MYRYFLVLLILALVSCNRNGSSKKTDANDSSMIPASLVKNPNTPNGIDTGILNNKPTMDLVDTFHDFGKIKQGITVSYEFEFKNNGKTPLIITSAQGSCGCTVADYAHEPILSGQTGKLKAIFNSNGKNGHQEKSISVTTNSKRGIHMLYIKADVEVPGDKAK